MSETELAPNGAETVDESVDNTENSDDNNSIRALLQAQLADGGDAQPDAEPEETTENDDSEAETPITDDDAPPQSLTADEREIWQRLDQDARDVIQRREKDYQAGLKTDAELQKVLQPVADSLPEDIHLDQYVGNLIQADRAIGENPVGVVELILQNNPHLVSEVQKLVGTPTNTAPAAEDDRVADLQREIAQLRQESSYTRELSQAEKEWNAFQVDHPDAERYSKLMAAEIQSNPGLSFEKAYDAAKALVNETAAAKEKRTIEAKANHANKANKLNLPKGSSAAPPQSKSTGNLRNDIALAMEETGYK